MKEDIRHTLNMNPPATRVISVDSRIERFLPVGIESYIKDLNSIRRMEEC